jgi:hypothetical protein
MFTQLSKKPIVKRTFNFRESKKTYSVLLQNKGHQQIVCHRRTFHTSLTLNVVKKVEDFGAESIVEGTVKTWVKSVGMPRFEKFS